MPHLAENRKARFDYDITETLEAGLELLGSEVKSAKTGKMNIAGARAIVRGGELWLAGADIPAHQPKNAPKDYDPSRVRRLLLHREEIARLTGLLKAKGVSILPLKIYLKRGIIKIELGIGRGRKKADKRESLKKRAMERDAGRRL